METQVRTSVCRGRFALLAGVGGWGDVKKGGLRPHKGLEAHQKRRHPRPPVPNDERDADGEREA